MNDLDVESYEILEKFYFKLVNILKRENNYSESKPILKVMLGFTQTKILKIIDETSINIGVFKRGSTLNHLIENAYLKMQDDKNKLDECIISAKGIWIIDKKRNQLADEDLLDFIDEKYFSSNNSGKDLSDKNIIILFVMIGLRFFSNDVPMNLCDLEKLNKWLPIFYETKEFCLQNKIIKRDIVFDQKGVEHPITYLLRRAQDLPEMTDYIFNFSNVKNKQYYLDIANSDGDNRKKVTLKLSHLFKKILHNCDNPEDLIQKVLLYLNNIAHDKGIYFIDDFKYITYEWDDILNDALIIL